MDFEVTIYCAAGEDISKVVLTINAPSREAANHSAGVAIKQLGLKFEEIAVRDTYQPEDKR